MKPIALSSEAGLFCLILVSCVDPTSVETNPQVMTKAVSSSKLEDRVFEEVNKHRRSIGKNSVKKHKGLELLARQHAEFLAKNSPRTASGRKLEYHHGFERRSDIAKYSYGIEAIGENIAKSSDPDSKRFVRLWKESGQHRWTLNTDWTYTGIGVARDPSGYVIVTQIFGSD